MAMTPENAITGDKSEGRDPSLQSGYRFAGWADPLRLRARVKRSAWIIAAVVCAFVLASAVGLVIHLTHAGSGSPGRAGPAPQLHVQGNALLDAGGHQVVLHGVDRSGGEYSCVQGSGFWSGPVNQASVVAMKQWGVNSVRIPMNEACWNGESYVPRQYRGLRYQQAVESYVRLLNRNGMVAILDLQWTDGSYNGPSAVCSSAPATCAKPMPDAAQAIPFWASVARAFKGNHAVIFDVFNEPYPQAAAGSENQCWLHGGGDCPGISYRAAGMQQLVNAIRSAGAGNVIMVGGIGWANDLTQWLRDEPADPDHNLVAAWHSYNFNRCVSPACWNRQIAPVIAKVPVIAAEIGQNGCADSYIDPLMNWLDARSTGYLAWAWNADFNCSSGPSLITNYTGIPTAYGAGYRSHLKTLK
jgi:endoglucanase